MEDVIADIGKELSKLSSNKSNIKDYSRFHKDNKNHINLATPIVRIVSSKFFNKIKGLNENQILDLCEMLLKTKDSNKRQIAFDWAFRLRKHYKKEHFAIFEIWLNSYVDDWGSCDDFCTHALGEFLLQFPEFLTNLEKWTMSTNRWVRRGSAVALIYPLKHKHYLSEAFKISNALISDNDNLVQKGCGWMLKEASNNFKAETFDYLLKHKTNIPRVTLRYAVEKMPKESKKLILS